MGARIIIMLSYTLYMLHTDWLAVVRMTLV